MMNMEISKRLCLFLSLAFIFGLSGCAVKKAQNTEEIDTALESVAGALVGKELTPEEVKKLKKEIQTNPEARDAVKKITDSLQEPAAVKYCPVDGQRYAPNLKLCPAHKVELKTLIKE